MNVSDSIMFTIKIRMKTLLLYNFYYHYYTSEHNYIKIRYIQGKKKWQMRNTKIYENQVKQDVHFLSMKKKIPSINKYKQAN